MRPDRAFLRTGYVAAVAIGLASYLLNFSLAGSIAALVAVALVTRAFVYAYFERYLAFEVFDDFVAGRVRHECVACGASCHLRVNLGKDDVERIVKYAKEKGIEETVIEKSGDKFWLRRKSGGACVFLTYAGNVPRCSIYPIRPVACRLFPLIPQGTRLKVDPFCPGISREHGHTFKEHLTTQEVGSHVRKVMGKI